MSDKLKGTKTEQNLLSAFAAESMARNKYTYFASQAKKDGFVHICEIFEETASNEKEHAKIWYKLLYDGISSTVKNLKDSIDTETEESTKIYPEYAKVAKEEGFDKIADLFEHVAEIEAFHSNRYQKLLNSLESKTIFKSDKKVKWQCSNCGHIVYAESAPELCAVCEHTQAYFERIE